MNSPSIPSVTSSQASAAGAVPSSSQAGPPTAQSGRDPAPASRSAPPESSSDSATSATSGPCSSTSSASANLSRSLGNRLRARLEKAGSMEFRQTWSQKATPAGRPYWAHTASARRTSDSASTGWPTPGVSIHGSAESPEQKKARGANTGTTLMDAVAGWPTPQEDNANNPYGHVGTTFSDLPTTAGWATPATRDYKDSGNLETSRFRKDGKERNDTLARQVPSGQTSSSSPAPTEKRAGLNPDLPRWLMGFPPEWCASAVTAMQSFPKSRRPSSKAT